MGMLHALTGETILLDNKKLLQEEQERGGKVTMGYAATMYVERGRQEGSWKQVCSIPLIYSLDCFCSIDSFTKAVAPRIFSYPAITLVLYWGDKAWNASHDFYRFFRRKKIPPLPSFLPSFLSPFLSPSLHIHSRCISHRYLSSSRQCLPAYVFDENPASGNTTEV